VCVYVCVCLCVCVRGINPMATRRAIKLVSVGGGGGFGEIKKVGRTWFCSASNAFLYW
jgi:hypothetical protein